MHNTLSLDLLDQFLCRLPAKKHSKCREAALTHRPLHWVHLYIAVTLLARCIIWQPLTSGHSAWDFLLLPGPASKRRMLLEKAGERVWCPKKMISLSMGLRFITTLLCTKMYVFAVQFMCLILRSHLMRCHQQNSFCCFIFYLCPHQV